MCLGSQFVMIVKAVILNSGDFYLGCACSRVCILYTVCSLIKFNASVTSWFTAGTDTEKVSRFCCFHGTMLHSYRENLLELGGESYNFIWEPEIEMCVQLHQRKHCFTTKTECGQKRTIEEDIRTSVRINKNVKEKITLKISSQFLLFMWLDLCY
jgi:hypothetical protein